MDFSNVPWLLTGVWVTPTVTDEQLSTIHAGLEFRCARTVRRKRLELRQNVRLTEKAQRALQRQKLDAVVFPPGYGGENDPQAVHSLEGETGT